jgi:stage III sporulation protein AG
MELTEKIMGWVRKYRFVVLILLVGIGLMLIPFGDKEKTETSVSATAPTQPDISKELSQILSQIDGAGEVSVMLTVRTGTSTVYQTDDSHTTGESGTTRQDTVIITDENRAQSGLVQHIVYPEYRGAIIVCQGADNLQVRLNIMEAVARITGLGMDKISVLKMK